MLTSLTEQLLTGTDLSNEQVVEAVKHITSEEISAEEKANFLTALANKGESHEELAHATVCPSKNNHLTHLKHQSTLSTIVVKSSG